MTNAEKIESAYKVCKNYSKRRPEFVQRKGYYSKLVKSLRVNGTFQLAKEHAARFRKVESK